jgi:streptogramin lyase
MSANKKSQFLMSHVVALLLVWPAPAGAHPGAGIVVNRRGEIFFTDTGKGVWKIDSRGKLTFFDSSAYHWMTMSDRPHAAVSPTWGKFQRIAAGNNLLITSSDVPIAIGPDGSLWYAHQSGEQPLEVFRQTPDGDTSVIVRIAGNATGQPLKWFNGIAIAPDGSLYFTEDGAVRKISGATRVTTILQMSVSDCLKDSVPDLPPGPYLRGLAVGSAGELYVAATGCRSVLRIGPGQEPITLLRSESPWSPTGVAVHRSGIYVLEVEHVPVTDREWRPRVRRVAAEGTVTTLATVNRGPAQGR